MKTSLLLALLTTLAVGTPYVIAQTAPKTAGKPAATAPSDMDKEMAQMQENLKRMQQQMDKIRQTKDPKERQKLLQEHMQSMQEGMNMMRGMGGPMMMEQMMQHHESRVTPRIAGPFPRDYAPATSGERRCLTDILTGAAAASAT